MDICPDIRFFLVHPGIGPDFGYSRGWVARFKDRHNIKSHKIHGESGSADEGAVAHGREALSRVIAGYDLSDVYNLDETALFFKLGPSATLSAAPVSGTKRNKQRVTVALVCNATGTHKVKPIVVAKAKRPRCFGKRFDPAIYCHYYHNKTAWMTSSIFTDVVRRLDNCFRQQGRSVLVLLDNAGCHTLDGAQLTNIKLAYIPPNTTSHLQPLDAGIIRAFKAHYRKQLVREFILCAEEEKPQNVDLRWSLRAIAASWTEVTERCIANCWRRSGLTCSSAAETGEDEPEDNTTLAELQREIRRLHPKAPETAAESFVAGDDAAGTCAPLDDDSIVALVRGSDIGEVDEAETDDEAPELVSRASARQHLSKALLYFEQQADAESANTAARLLARMSEMQGNLRQTSIPDFL